jgi:hypothetical protein
MISQRLFNLDDPPPAGVEVRGVELSIMIRSRYWIPGYYYLFQQLPYLLGTGYFGANLIPPQHEMNQTHH